MPPPPMSGVGTTTGVRPVVYSLFVIALLGFCVVVFDVPIASRDCPRPSDQGVTIVRAGSGGNAKSRFFDEPSSAHCLDPNGPQPYILMTLGRSGSGSTWQIIGNLTGYETESEEYPGSDTYKAKSFLKKRAGDGGKWVLEKLCKKQRHYPDAGVVGFKLKPFHEIHDLPAFREGLELIANSPIKVVRSRRNLLDVMISRTKHSSKKLFEGNMEKVPAHCWKGDEECIRLHMEAETGMTLKAEGLLKSLEITTKGEDEFDDILNTVGIKHVSVSYEKLYHDDDAEEWLRIFRFLGVGPRKGLMRKHVEGAMEHVGTSNPHHNVTLANYEEIKSLLRGTDYENLLHRI